MANIKLQSLLTNSLYLTQQIESSTARRQTGPKSLPNPIEVKDYKALEQISKSFEKKNPKNEVYNLE